jgi:hypothetical protein
MENCTKCISYLYILSPMSEACEGCLDWLLDFLECLQLRRANILQLPLSSNQKESIIDTQGVTILQRDVVYLC